MVSNGLSSDTIYPGEDLLIPLTLCRGNECFGGNGIGSPPSMVAAAVAAGGQRVASMRDLCRSSLCRRTHRRRLPSPTVLGASFIGGEELSDFTVMALKALQVSVPFLLSPHPPPCA